MHELVVNLHMHTRYSDGTGLHRDIAAAAIRAGLDAVIVTDHNVLVRGPEGYYREGNRRVLLMIGEEIHDQDRDPQKNHLLVFGADRELAPLADDPQALIDAAREAGGLTFIAHPIDPAQPAFHEPDISWESWDVRGFTGIELWNGFSEFKAVIPTLLHALFYAYFPRWIARGPLPAVLRRWDDLLTGGMRAVAVGGSDAHALHVSLGPLRRILFPYEFHFRSINTHVLTPRPLSGDATADGRMILEALAAGHAFVGYDLPASTRGFRFTARSRDQFAGMGDEIAARGGITLQARLPGKADIRLIKDGGVLRTWANQEAFTYATAEPGVYRVEARRPYRGRRVGWIYSNPIYVR